LKILLDSDEVPDSAKDLILTYQEWSQYNTIRSRYIRQLEDYIGPDSRIHPTYSLTYTSSGRTGARNPSVQNFPKRFAAAKLIRQLMVAPPGWVLLETDHSMSELRWTAEVANDENMKQIFHQYGDIHLFTGANLAGHLCEVAEKQKMIDQIMFQYDLSNGDVKSIRQNAKAVNFGLIYRMSALGLKNYAYQGFGVKLTDKQSNQWRRDFFKLYPRVEPWHNEVIREMEETGSVVTIFGRKIPVPNIYSSDRKTAAEAERFGINTKIQGPSSDYTLLGGLNAIEDEKFDSETCRACMFIHDAVIWETRLENIDYNTAHIQYKMVDVETEKRFGFSLDIPFVVDGEYGFNLKDTEKYISQEA
jgi:DNA polymerase-1